MNRALCTIDSNGFGTILYAAGEDLERHLLNFESMPYLEDVWERDQPPAEFTTTPGLLVWEGDVLEDDRHQPILRGAWRDLTAEEFATVQQRQFLWEPEMDPEDREQFADQQTREVLVDFIDRLQDRPHTKFVCELVGAVVAVARQNGIAFTMDDDDDSREAN